MSRLLRRFYLVFTVFVLSFILAAAFSAAYALEPSSPEETRDIVIRANESIGLRGSQPLTMNYFISGINVSKVQVSSSSTSLNFTFTDRDFYLITLILTPKDPADTVQLIVFRQGQTSNNIIGTYVLSGTVSFNLKLRVSVLEAAVGDGRPVAQGAPSLQFLEAIPDDIKNSLRLIILFVPLAYFGGYIGLEIADHLRDCLLYTSPSPRD